jgi:hypothetical protein
MDPAFQNPSVQANDAGDSVGLPMDTAILESTENPLAIVQNSVEAWATNALDDLASPPFDMDAGANGVTSSQAESEDEICYGMVSIKCTSERHVVETKIL